MENKSLKILVGGPLNGNWSKFLKKINSINKKSGPFELVICTGSVFSNSPEARKDWQKCLSGELKAAVPMFVLGPSSIEEAEYYKDISIQDGGELCTNVTYLGKKGVFKTLSGLSIAYISGQEKKAAVDSPMSHFTKNDVDDMIRNVCSQEGFIGVDILVTNVWPAGVTKYTSFQDSPASEVKSISLLTSKLKPRYHFSCSPECYFERPPYRNHQVLLGQQEHVTRFISLASFNNKESKKAIYAFSITPLEYLSRSELIKQPEDTTEFPFTGSSHASESNRKEQDEKPDNFFFNVDDKGKRKTDNKEHSQRSKKAKGPPTLSQPCWFCLGSPKVEKHLVVSIGEHCYLALPKGGLTKDHIMICPIEHHHSTVVLDDEALMEVEKYKKSLRKMFEADGKEIVIFERNFYTQHFQLQVVPVPKEDAEDLKGVFLMAGAAREMNLTEMEPDVDLKEVVQRTTPYFVVELHSGQRLLHRVVGGMPLQFGREVLASVDVLNIPEKVDWKSCKLSHEEETELAKSFRKRYQTYDFTS